MNENNPTNRIGGAARVEPPEDAMPRPMEYSDIHDQASLDRFWAENGGRPLTVAEEAELAAAREAVIEAAIRADKLTCLPPVLSQAIWDLLRLRAGRQG